MACCSIKKSWLWLLAIVALVGMGIWKQQQVVDEQTPSTLRVGLQSGYPPFEYINDRGDLVGFDIDLAQALARQMGKTVQFKDMEFEAEILSLKHQQIDMIISGMNITPSRLKEIDMIPYYGSEAREMSLVFWGVIPQGVSSLHDLAGCRVSVESGSIPEMYLEQFPEVCTTSFQGSLAPLMDVKYGKSVANLVQVDVARYLAVRYPEVQVLQIPIEGDTPIGGFGIGIRKDAAELKADVQKALSELKESGLLAQLEQQWFHGDSCGS